MSSSHVGSWRSEEHVVQSHLLLSATLSGSGEIRGPWASPGACNRDGWSETLCHRGSPPQEAGGGEQLGADDGLEGEDFESDAGVQEAPGEEAGPTSEEDVVEAEDGCERDLQEVDGVPRRIAILRGAWRRNLLEVAESLRAAETHTTPVARGLSLVLLGQGPGGSGLGGGRHRAQGVRVSGTRSAGAGFVTAGSPTLSSAHGS